MSSKKKKTKPRLQPRCLAKSISFSATPDDKKRLLVWMKAQQLTNRSKAFRCLLDAVGA